MRTGNFKVNASSKDPDQPAEIHSLIRNFAIFRYVLQYRIKHGFSCINNGFSCINNGFSCINNGFSCINIRQVPREVLKTEAGGRGFQHLPRDLANVNA